MGALNGYRAVPRYLSVPPLPTDISGPQRAAQELGIPLLPQGEQVATVLEAKNADGYPEWPRVVIQMARRSTKTSAIQAVLLSRCMSIPNYKVISTAQTQSIARSTFMELIYALEMAYPDEENAPFKIRISNGQEGIRFDNGSHWHIVSPKASSFRSKAADAIWLDEAGEYSDDQTQDLIQGAMPLMDTRPMGQVIVSGTPAKNRSGLLWDELVAARQGAEGYGVVDYSMSELDDFTLEETWIRVHPGISSGLVPLKTVKARFESMPASSFCREYLCKDPDNLTTAAIPSDLWKNTQVPNFLEVPANAIIGIASHPDATGASIAATWYADDKPHIQLLAYKPGIDWVSKELAKILKEHPRTTILYDSMGNNLSIIQDLKRIPGIPTQNLTPVNIRQMSAGVTTLLTAIQNGTLVHAKDRDLDNAAMGASLRMVNDSRLLGRRASVEDVSPLEACAVSLYYSSGNRVRTDLKGFSVKF